MMNNLFSELKRRNIFRVAGVYAVVGWILAQASAVLENAMNLPIWFDTMVVSLLLIGFPVALLMAWAFEMTPQGVKRTEVVAEGESITGQTGRKLDITIVIGLALVVLLLVWQSLNKNGQTQKPSIAAEATSIAVLPFVDLSPNGDQEFFADGISEEILNVLVPIEGLKVAGRTSSFSFKGRNQDLREIGAALNVNHVLEGSVRRSGTKLRITAQLIRSDDGFHLWSETYDRELTDIFEIQDEIARSVADQLAASLGLSFGLSSETLVTERTEDIVAYELYLKAKQLYEKRGKDNLDTALLLLSETVARDPNFAPAWSQISRIYSVYQSYYIDTPTEAMVQHWRAIGKAAARRAIKLSPDNGEAHSSLGMMYTYDFDWIKVFEEFDKALVLAPDNASIRDGIAQTLSEVGQYEKAIEMSLRAIEIDPFVAIYHVTLGDAYFHNGEYEKAIAQQQYARKLDQFHLYATIDLIDIYVYEDRLEEGLKLAETAFALGIISQKKLDSWKVIYTAFVSDDSDAISALLEGNDEMDVFTRHMLAYKINDKQAVIKAWDLYWNTAYQEGQSYSIFRNYKMDFIYDQPRFKQQVRKDNILAYWQHAGFPPYCHAVGTDDFECE